jgi:hypothetical protein
MISGRLHGQIYPLSILLLTHLHLVFRICIFSFSSYKSKRKSLFSFAFRMPVRCPCVDHTNKILRIIVNFLIVFYSVFCPFCLSSSALIHYSLGFPLKKKNTFLRQYKHSYYFCFIYFLCFRCPAGSACPFTFAASWVLLWSVCLTVRPSASPSGFTAVSVFPKVDLLCQHSNSTPIFSSLVG